uniref:NACHT domain-containing protein n=2 Tax=Bionectria ochroleuca TaxID=29856 RepID=A0A0B7JP21_BIOOC
MDVALRNAALLRPEIALAKAISEFESSLTKEHKSNFRSFRTQALSASPSAEDVMRFTASLNSQIQKSSAAHRCFGTRFTNIMQCVQKYAALGDVVVGGSQNIIACGVWALVRLTIQVCIGFGSYLDKVSHFFMTVGQSAPRYESMALLYRRSKLLSHYMSSYFLVIVQTCHEFMLFSRKSFLGQLTASLDDSKLRDAQSRSERLGAKIREEVSFLTTQTVESEASENNLFRALVGGAYSWETQQRKLRQRAKLLEALSSSDHETPFRQARKCGVSTVFEDEPAYLSWEQSTESTSLVLVGKLGSGKSVTMASIIDNLYLSSHDRAVSFFFCRHDNAEALTARAVIGSLGRQLIDKYFKDSLLDNVVDGVTTMFSLGDVLRLVKDTVPRDARIHFVLDGVDECQEYDAIEIIKALGEIQKFMYLSVCVSIRSGTQDHQSLFRPLLNIQTMTMPEKNPDIGKFIEKELERRIEAKRLVLGQEGLVVEIRDALVKGANGMFLWVALQIDSLCDEKSDAAIRSALQDLPPDLFSTFDRILKRSRKLAHTYQTRILKTIVAAHRPLTVDEIREVISVEPGNTDWSPDMLVNDIHGVLACCGSLVTVDEENLSVYLIHQSVTQFLLERPTATSGSSNPESHFTMEEAQKLLGESVITYLNCSLFERQISKDVAHEVRVGELPSRVMQEALAPAGVVGQLAIRWLKSASNPEFDAKKALTEVRGRQRSRQATELFHFLSYASKYWLQHSSWISQESKLFELWVRLLENPRFDELTWTQDFASRDNLILDTDTGVLWSFSQRIMWAIINAHIPLFRYEMKGRDWSKAFGTVIPYLRRCMQCNPRPRIAAKMCTQLLPLVALFKDHAVVGWLVSMGASLPFDSNTAFYNDISDSNYAIVKAKLSHDRSFFSKSQVGQLLDLALLKGDSNMVKLLCHLPGLPLSNVLSGDTSDPLVIMIIYHLLKGVPRLYHCNVDRLWVDIKLIHHKTNNSFFDMTKAILEAANRSMPRLNFNALIENGMERYCLLSDLSLVQALRPWLRDDAKVEVISSFIRHALHDRSIERSKIVSIIWRYIDSAWNKDSEHYNQYVELAREALIRCLQLRDWDLARDILLRNASQSSVLSIRAIKISLRHYIIESNLLHYCADAADWDGLTFLTKDVEFPLNNSIARFSSQYDYQTPLEIALGDDFENILSFGNAVRTIQILLGSRSYGKMKRQSYETEAFEAFEDFEGFEAFESFLAFLNRLRDLPDFSPGMTGQAKQIIDAILNVPRDSDKDYTVQLLLWCILQSYSGAFTKSDIKGRTIDIDAFFPKVGVCQVHYNLLIDATLSFRTTEKAKIMVPSQLVDRIGLIDRWLPGKLHNQGCERFEAQADAVPGWLLLNIPEEDIEDVAPK